MKKYLTIGLVAVSFAVAAQEQPKFGVGIEGGIAVSNALVDATKNEAQRVANYYGETTYYSADRRAGFGRLYGEYRFNPIVGAEIGLFSTTKFKSNIHNSYGSADYSARVYGLDAAAKINPLANGFYVKLGAHQSTAELSGYSSASSSGIGWLAGLGYEQDFTKNIAGNIGYTHYARLGGDNDVNANVFYVGGKYKF